MSESLFGQDPLWLVIVKVVGVFALLVLLTLFTIWFERRVVGRMQHRIGPNRNGPQGLLQSLMDGVKLALKEEIIPKAAHKAVYWIAPILSATAAFMAFAVIPLGGEVSIFGTKTMLQVTDLPVGVLYVVAIASIGIYGIVLAGWASGSTYPLLGGLRSSAQMISYEVAMSLSFVAVFLYAGSMSTSDIVMAQQDIWYIILLLPSFMIYVISMVGETNRAPFDLPEAEGELVGGFHTEYTSFKFAMFYLAEYINMITVSAVATTLFLGGYKTPWPLSSIEFLNTGWMGLVWVVAKIMVFLFVFVWLRGTLPRLRYDQFMKFGWKILIPAAIAWIVIVSTARALRNEGIADTQSLLFAAGAILLVVVGLSYVADLQKRDSVDEAERAFEQRAADSLSSYPVPPLPGQEFVVQGQEHSRG